MPSSASFRDGGPSKRGKVFALHTESGSLSFIMLGFLPYL